MNEKPLTVQIEECKQLLAKIVVDSKLPAIIWKDCILPPLMEDLRFAAQEQLKSELNEYNKQKEDEA